MAIATNLVLPYYVITSHTTVSSKPLQHVSVCLVPAGDLRILTQLCPESTSSHVPPALENMTDDSHCKPAIAPSTRGLAQGAGSNKAADVLRHRSEQ